jgi:hypothetical protein
VGASGRDYRSSGWIVAGERRRLELDLAGELHGEIRVREIVDCHCGCTSIGQRQAAGDESKASETRFQGMTGSTIWDGIFGEQ